jgi:hypothetical protein
MVCLLARLLGCVVVLFIVLFNGNAADRCGGAG